ncbi:hypothetical protein MBH78_07230 [Oceanimonas sp. NS1]|nr:hypothetical protein [Oceanimonas sp. NS1]
MNKHWLWAGLLLPGLLLADDAEIRRAIEEGTRAYEAGEWSQAASQFDYAATLVRQLQAGQLGELFPAPCPAGRRKTPIPRPPLQRSLAVAFTPRASTTRTTPGWK